ncbi:MAG: DUF2723 domain-containing protein [Deltaproteobacteria bacterium]|nr:DUF2723 domain-containing protein [Deltaproteobacteria bacterium]
MGRLRYAGKRGLTSKNKKHFVHSISVRSWQVYSLPPLLLFVFFLLIYMFTMCPTVYWGDSAEFSWVPATGGILHPSGYPLFTMLCRAFSLLPFGNTAQASNAVSAFAGALSVVGIYFLSRTMGFGIAESCAASAMLGFDGEVWMQSTVAEVYTLHLALGLTAIALALKWREQPTALWLGILGLVCGLSLANHLTTVLWLPALAYLILTKWRNLEGTGVALSVGGLFIGLSFYAYLPLVAMDSPSFNQGDPVTLQAFWNHVSGSQYTYRLFSMGLREILKGAANDIEDIFSRTSGIVFLTGLLGMAWLTNAKKKMPMAHTLLITLLLLVSAIFLYTFNYNIPDRSGYLLLVDSCLVIGATVFINRLSGLSSIRRKVRPVLKLSMAIVFPGIVLLGQFLDQRDGHANDYTLEHYSEAVLKEMPSNGLLMVEDLEVYHALRYMQGILGRRKDVTPVCEYLLRLPWYLDQLKRDDPDLILPKGLQQELKVRVEALKDAGKRSVGKLSGQIASMVEKRIISANIGSRPVYRCPHEDVKWATEFLGFDARFNGLTYELSRNKLPDRDFPLSYLPRSLGPDKNALKTPRMKFVQSRYATAFNRRGIIRARLGKTEDAVSDFKKALEYDADYKAALKNIEALERIRDSNTELK